MPPPSSRPPSKSIFLSAATDDYEALRARLAERLRKARFRVIHQKELQNTGVNTLVNLAMTIAKESTTIIQVIGPTPGACPAPELITELFRHRPLFPTAASFLDRFDRLREGERYRRLTYTQWEAWFGKYFEKELLVFRPRDFPPATDGLMPMSQGEHESLLRAVGGYPTPFTTEENLNTEVLTVLHVASGPGVTVLVPDPASVNPYVSLVEFTEETAQFFRGRDAEIERVVAAIEHHSVVAITGPSGSGKSSLARAGVIPALRAKGWRQLIFRPQHQPFVKLNSVVRNVKEGALADARCLDHVDADRLRQPRGFYAFFDEWLAAAPHEKILLFVNQFEELFTSGCDPAVRHAFVEGLTDLPEPERFKILVTLRKEFYYQAAVEELGGRPWISLSVPLGTIAAGQLREVIEGPAADLGVRFEPELVERLLADAGAAEGILPLLEYCLYQLWERRAGDTLTVALYESIGTLHGCIARKADEVYGQLLQPERQTLALRLLRHLINPEKDARRQRHLADLCNEEGVTEAAALEVLTPFDKARLIVFDTDETEHRCVDFSHEAVFRNWRPLQELLKRSREYLIWRWQLRVRVDEWLADQRDDRRLLQDELLAYAAEQRVEYTKEVLATDEEDYLRRSTQRQRDRDEGRLQERIKALLSATAENVRDLFAGVTSRPDLLHAELAAADPGPTAQQCRLRLALLQAGDHAANHAGWLAGYALQAEPGELLLIRESLAGMRDELTSRYWPVALNPAEDIDRRFRAACMLASLDPTSGRWAGVVRFVASRLVQEPPRFLRGWMDALQPVAATLRQELSLLTRDSAPRETVRSAVLALGRFTGADPVLLAGYLCDATDIAFQELFGRLTSSPVPPAVVDQLAAVARTAPASAAVAAVRRHLEDESVPGLTAPDGITREQAQVFIGKRRAGAAVALILLDDVETPLAAFEVTDDPEVVTQFAARAKARGITPADLLRCLDRCLGKPGSDAARFALMTALGEHPAAAAAIPFRGRSIGGWVQDWYATDPHGRIHGVCGWLARQWGLDTAAGVAAVTPARGRQWFTHPFGADHLTMIAYPPDTFLMGSPEDEEWRAWKDERQHKVTLTRPFALAEFQTTRKLYERFLDATGRDKSEFDSPEGSSRHALNPDPRQPVSGLTWKDAVEFCRWLTAEAGMTDADQSYVPAANSRGYELRPDRPGFRLPTEAEREYAGRAGVVTAYSFGSDRELLERYGWHMPNAARWPNPVGMLRPDLRGLSDTHGNVFEWCHDWYGPYPVGHVSDPTGPEVPGKNQNQVLRGGGWYSHAADCRSASRNLYPSEKFFLLVGFRIAASLPW